MKANVCPLTHLPCHEDKCIHMIDINNFKLEKELHLCLKCGNDFIEDEWHSQVYDEIQKEATKKKVPIEKKCPKCGHKIKDIVKTSRLGCDVCYVFFREELLPVFMVSHKAIQHVGKKPTHPSTVMPVAEQIVIYEKKLEEAVQKEEFETAQQLKAKIDYLKKRL